MTTTLLRFSIKLIVGFALLIAAFEASRGTAIERALVEDMILAPTAQLINAITPQEHVKLVGRTLASPGANLRITRGCEGVEMFLMLVACILAFPAPWKRRVQALVVGSILAYVLSLARLMALHYLLRYSPTTWEALHGLVLPLVPLILMALYFTHWTQNEPSGAAMESEPSTA